MASCSHFRIRHGICAACVVRRAVSLGVVAALVLLARGLVQPLAAFTYGTGEIRPARRETLLAVGGVLAGCQQTAAWAEEFSDAPRPPRVDDFTLQLPSRSWKIKTEVQQAIRVRKERVFEASEPDTKASVIVTRTPLGADRSEAEMRDNLVELAGAFDKKAGTSLAKEDIVKIITGSFDDPASRRARQWLSVERRPEISEYQDVSGQRYVRFAYDAEECTGPVTPFKRYDGVMVDDCDGRMLPPRRHYLTAMVQATKYTSMRSNYLDGSNAMRSRNIESLWLLDASAPVSAIKKKGLGEALDGIASSFQVTPPSFQED